MKRAIVILLFMVSFGAISQKKELRKKLPAYIDITIGKGYSRFVDFATSPLTYSGAQNYISLSYDKFDKIKEKEYGFSYSFGEYKNKFNEHESISTSKTLSLFYSQLYQLNKFSSDKLTIKIGGLFDVAGNFRVNESLGNNGVGLEVIPTLYGSIKISKYFISRRGRDKELSFRLNIGLINSSYRNGYVYSGQSFILNKPILQSVFDDYQFKIFSGFGLNSALSYTMPLKNKNRIQFSYLWGAYKIGGNFDRFQTANHTIKFTLLFNLNNH